MRLSSRCSRRAALNLSVEAIIIFVLAFAMLGVGLFITDLLREGASKGIQEALGTLEDLGEKPTAQKPITGITKEGLDLEYNELITITLGYYNKDRQPAADATVIIDYCKSGSTGDVVQGESVETYPIRVETIPTTVEPSTAEAFSLSLQNNGLNSGDLYFCKLKIVTDGDHVNVYEQKQIVVNVIS